jgi:hypothetical protein
MTHITKDEALKLALEALENYPSIGLTISGVDAWNHCHKAITAIKQALATPVQPVAWMVESDDRRHFIFPAHQKPMIHEGETLTPLYTALLAQPAEPLTDKQLLEILVGIDSETKRLPSGFKDFARAIEAAHGITKGQE